MVNFLRIKALCLQPKVVFLQLLAMPMQLCVEAPATPGTTAGTNIDILVASYAMAWGVEFTHEY